MPHGDSLNGINLLFGSEGKPFLTRKNSAPDYKNDYPFYMQPQPMRHVSIDILDLANTNDYEYYLKIWQAVGLGSVQVVDESKQWVEDSKNWKVFIRWYIRGKMDPAELRSEVARATRNLRSAGPQSLGAEGEADGTL